MSTHRSLNLDTLVLLTSAYFSLGANRFNQAQRFVSSFRSRHFLFRSIFSLFENFRWKLLSELSFLSTGSPRCPGEVIKQL